MIYSVSINGFEEQNIQVKIGGLRGPRLLINGEVVPKGKKRKMTVKKDDGSEVIATFKNKLVGLPNLIVDGEEINVTEPLEWYVQIWCYMSLPLIFIGGALGACFSIIACSINTIIFRSSMNVILKYILSLVVTLIAIGMYLTLGYMATQALR
ncbi:MAG: hypothetical protein N4A48_03300 [Tepidibacter sp.]|jgi:hypothetical protein|uniref:hypothetical protein n=1 Tax=Tepidibacter sp. TaxID=2529387 RepID=UPI0025EA4A79|nr:hypothetical protein [Tepidibacter sp.]MCT4507774.1 hypothetical protein [Tepidibacter sp.]